MKTIKINFRNNLCVGIVLKEISDTECICLINCETIHAMLFGEKWGFTFNDGNQQHRYVIYNCEGTAIRLLNEQFEAAAIGNRFFMSLNDLKFSDLNVLKNTFKNPPSLLQIVLNNLTFDLINRAPREI